MRLTPDQEEYIYEKDTGLNDDITIELNERVVNYLESFRKGLISWTSKGNMAAVTAG